MYGVCDGQEKKLIRLQHYFLSVVYDGAREKTQSVITLFLLCCLWWRQRKNWFCYNIIFYMLSKMDQEKKLVLLSHYFLYLVYDGEREKTLTLKTSFFVGRLWWSKWKKSSCYNIIFFMFSLMKEEKKLIRLQHYFLHVVYDGARGKIHSFTTFFFVCCLWWSKRKNWFCYSTIFCMFSMMERQKKLFLL